MDHFFIKLVLLTPCTEWDVHLHEHTVSYVYKYNKNIIIIFVQNNPQVIQVIHKLFMFGLCEIMLPYWIKFIDFAWETILQTIPGFLQLKPDKI